MNIFKCKKLLVMALIFSTIMVLTHQHLPADDVFVWGGFQLGAYGGHRGGVTLAGGEFSLSAQFSRKGYGSVYSFGASEPFGNDDVSEKGFMVGRCFRTRSTFTGAAVGIGYTSSYSSRLQGIGVPLKLEGAVIIGGIMALNLQFRAFIWKRSYAGISLGLQLGKLR